MPQEPMKPVENEKERVLISFLIRTREGKYAPIDESPLPYSRLIEETETVEPIEEEFYYSIS
jgi:hypothetical protein